MMQYSYDVAVAWRIYPGVSKVPLIYPQDKWQLVRTCLLSFMQATGELRIRYYFILDGCPPAYRELIESLLPGPCTTILETPAMGNL
ncbi:MAG TPA: hypothetical protein PKE63_08030, partial [Lacibacter sp.]|nr:hypothetical protein [Lacibacter sp.]